MTKAVGIIDDGRFDAHEADAPHPERPERLEAARAGLSRALPPELRLRLSPRLPTAEELERAHSRTYLQRLERRLMEGGSGHLDADTYFGPGTREASLLAAGAALEMTTALLRGDVERGVALVRPPGHHARPDTAMGFCLLNNVAIAARRALDEGAERVAILDWDVHHGNGTQEMFYDDPRVLFVSLHQFPFYPGTGAPHEVGEGAGRGFTANVGLPSGSGPEAYGLAFRDVVLPVLDAFRADLVLVSAGFDAHARDPLASMHLDAATYGAMTTALVRHVEATGHGKLGVVLEGGYDLVALEESVGAMAEALVGQATELPVEAPGPHARAAVEATRNALRPYWTALESV